jgi:hypothetical protein
MPADPRMLAEVKAFLERQRLEATESEEQYCLTLEVRDAQKAYVSVFDTGTLAVGGPASPLKSLLEEMKAAFEAGGVTPGQALPFEIERFPEAIRERVPAVDPIVVAFIREALVCVKADALLAAAFMLGAASEKAINLLIHAYADSIRDETNRAKFQSRINGRMISAKYDEFEKSYRGCKSRPEDPALAQDLEVLIAQVFHFCRITRNEVGHPEIVPDLARDLLLANLGHFAQYIERVYRLMDDFRTNGVEVASSRQITSEDA